MATRSSVPAVEFRNLLVQLGLRRELDPDDNHLRDLMEQMVSIGDEAGALTRKLDASEDVFPFTDGAHPVSTFDWDNGELPVTPEQSDLIATVAELTKVPE